VVDHWAIMNLTWIRIIAGIAAAALAVVVGVSITGAFDTTADANGIPAGSNLFALILALSLLVGVIAWAVVEWLQTHRIESISRQFGTRTIVLMVVAIALNITLGQTVGTALKLPLYLDSIGTILVGVLCGPVAGAATGIRADVAWSFALAGTPFAGPYAWPFAIVAGVIGLLAGLFGQVGVFRRRLDTPPAQLLAGIVVAVVAIGALVWTGIVPYYRSLCKESLADRADGLCFKLLADGPLDPVWLVLGFIVLGLIVAALVLLIIRLAIARDLGAVIVLVAGTGTGVVTALIAAPIVVLLGGVTGGGTDLLVAAFQQAGSDLQQAVVQQSLLVDPIDKAIEFSIAYVLLGSLSRRVAARFPMGERSLGTDEA
jgi:energy-coupling factor transport system substrate-specific component